MGGVGEVTVFKTHCGNFSKTNRNMSKVYLNCNKSNNQKSYAYSVKSRREEAPEIEEV